MAIVQQLQAETPAVFNSTRTDSVTLGAGANRLFLVGIAVDSGTNGADAPSSVTYGGVALSLVTDGVTQATRREAASLGSLNAVSVHWYALREAQLPSNGANNLVVTFPNTVNCVIGWWILEGCSQAANVVSVATNGTNVSGSFTTLVALLGPGALSDAVFCLGVNNSSSGTIQITIGGIGLTEDFDVDLTTNAARGAAGTDLTAPSIGVLPCDMTYTLAAAQRAAFCAIRIAQFDLPSGSATLEVDP